jgi:hypothetical protein
LTHIWKKVIVEGGIEKQLQIQKNEKSSAKIKRRKKEKL